MHNKPIIPISIAAELLEAHQRTLRIYDEKGKLILYLTRNLAMNLSVVETILRILDKLKVKEKNICLQLKKHQLRITLMKKRIF